MWGPHVLVLASARTLVELKRLGFTTKDADIRAAWLTRDQFGMAFLDQVGLMDISDLLATGLSKGLPKIGTKVLWG